MMLKNDDGIGLQKRIEQFLSTYHCAILKDEASNGDVNTIVITQSHISNDNDKVDDIFLSIFCPSFWVEFSKNP